MKQNQEGGKPEVFDVLAWHLFFHPSIVFCRWFYCTPNAFFFQPLFHQYQFGVQDDFRKGNEKSENQPSVNHFNARGFRQAAKQIGRLLYNPQIQQQIVPIVDTDKQCHHDQQSCHVNSSDSLKMVFAIEVGGKGDLKYFK